MKFAMMGIATAIAIFVLFYFAAAFVVWDLAWAKRMPDWKPEDRVFFLLLMGLIPVWIGLGVAVIPNRK